LSSSKNIPSNSKLNFKVKICLLGGTELYKNEFQRAISSHTLPIEYKRNMGVNISKIDYQYNHLHNFEFNLWNIDCNQNWAFLRVVFYRGAEAMIIFISEMKVDQIRQYLNEIKMRTPIITIIFCVILEKFTKEDITEAYFKNPEFGSMLETNQFKIFELSDPSEILEQISTSFLNKRQTKELKDNFIINFIQLNSLINQIEHNDRCNDYCEPENNFLRLNEKQRINLKKLKDLLLQIGFEIKSEYQNWIQIKNDNFGTFSIYLKNGRVYLTPKICEKCKKKHCIKFKKAPYFICIEAKSMGWSNINGIGQAELLVLSKIHAIENNLFPNSVLRQILKINTCIKNT